MNPSNPVYFSNRSAAFAGLKKFEAALTDAQKCLDLDKSFVKGYSRKGFALYKLGRISEAENCYTEGLVVDPENIALKEAAAAIRRTRELKEKAESKKGLLGKMGGWVSKLANGRIFFCYGGGGRVGVELLLVGKCWRMVGAGGCRIVGECFLRDHGSRPMMMYPPRRPRFPVDDVWHPVSRVLVVLPVGSEDRGSREGKSRGGDLQRLLFTVRTRQDCARRPKFR